MGEGWDTFLYGSVNDKILCPHCGERGQVRTQRSQQKAGISGGKVMGGLLTGGVSLLATGLSRKQWVTNARCGSCQSQWQF